MAERAGELIGYVVEGRRRECLLIDGVLVDELYMAKLTHQRGCDVTTRTHRADPCSVVGPCRMAIDDWDAERVERSGRQVLAEGVPGDGAHAPVLLFGPSA